MNRFLFPAAAAVLAIALGGCAIAPLGTPVPSVENIAAARAAAIAPVALGSFVLAAGRPAEIDEKVGIRSNTIHSPYDRSFAAYLKETLAADLRAAGLLDPASAIVISGELTDSEIDVPLGTAKATGTVAARFVVTRAGARVYERELRARAEWMTTYLGVETVPMAMNRYGLLYRQLVADLLQDPQLRSAARR